MLWGDIPRLPTEGNRNLISPNFMFYGGSKLKKKILFKFFEFAYGFVRITPQKIRLRTCLTNRTRWSYSDEMKWRKFIFK